MMNPEMPAAGQAETLALARGYRRAIEAGFALSPLIAITYIQFFQDPTLEVENKLLHRSFTAFVVFLGALIAFVAWRCHVRSGEAFQRWLSLGFSGFTVLYALHGLTPGGNDTDFWQFQFYDSASRLVLAGCLLAGLLVPDRPVRGKAPWRWLAWHLLLAPALGILIQPALHNRGVEPFMEAAIVTLCLANLVVMAHRRLQSPLMMIYGIALAIIGQASVSFLLADTWNHQWWLGHAIFLTGYLLLSYSIAKSALSSGSILKAPSQEDLFQQLAEANVRLQQALARAGEANLALERQIAHTRLAQQEFETLFALAPDAFLVVGPDGGILKANERACQVFGYHAEDFAALSIEELMPQQYRLAHTRHRDSYRQAPRPRQMACLFPTLRRDGSTFPAEISLSPLRFNDQDCTVAIIRDVTETQRFVEQLAISEQRFRQVFHHAPIGMALVEDGRIFEANDALCRIVGFEREELLHKHFLDITHPDDVAVSEAGVARLLAGEIDSLRLEKRYLRKDGRPIWAQLSSSVLRDAEGRPLYVISQIEDIDALKKTEVALAASEQRLQRVLEGSDDGFWDRHIPSGTTTFSPRWAAMLGYTSEQIEADLSVWERLVHPDDLPMCRQMLEEHFAGKRTRYEMEYRMRHKQGRWIWVLGRGKVYEWDTDGRPLRIAGTMTDVTARRRATAALMERERTLEAVLQALPVGVWIANTKGRIVSINPAAKQLLRERRPAIGAPAAEAPPAADARRPAPHEWALARAVEKREKVLDQLVEVESARGERKTVLNSAVPILDERGEPLGAVAINQDMTRWLRLEQDLLSRTHQLEESNRELEQFAYVASHDLQEPLRKVSSFVQLLARRCTGQVDETGRTYVDFIVDGAQRMQTLIDDLLHYSRMTRGDGTAKTLDMNALVTAVLDDLRTAIDEAGVEVGVQPLPAAHGDPARIRSLVQNLVSNAVKYRGEEQPKVEIGGSADSRFVTIWVRDNGIGIDPRYFERIFVIFQRLHTRGEYPGTGIGLAVCKRIVESHGGRIWLESMPGQGATFYFTLPAEGGAS